MLAHVGGVRVLHLHSVFVGGVFVFGHEDTGIAHHHPLFGQDGIAVGIVTVLDALG